RLPGRGRRDRQGRGGSRPRRVAQGRDDGPGDRRRRGPERLRHPAGPARPRDVPDPGRAVPRRGPVPRRKHGAQDPRVHRLRTGERRDRRHHVGGAHARSAGSAERRGHPHRSQTSREHRMSSIKSDLARGPSGRDTYLDSLRLLVATSVMSEQDGVAWAGAVMATPAGWENLRAEGFDEDFVGEAGANDLVLAVRARDEDAAEAALDAGAQAAYEDAAAEAGEAAAVAPRTVGRAVEQLPGASVAVVSVPGDYAALEAHHALSEGLHVLLFSDNVSLDEEAELKKRGEELGLLVMGPGAGTAVISGTGLGFSNEVRRGPVGVVAAAGTGAQEVA